MAGAPPEATFIKWLALLIKWRVLLHFPLRGGRNPVIFHVFIKGMTDRLVRLWPQIFIQYSTLDRFHLCLADICGIVSHTLKISERASVPFVLSFYCRILC